MSLRNRKGLSLSSRGATDERELVLTAISGRLAILSRRPVPWASPHVDRETVLRARSLLNARPFDQTFGVVRNAPLRNPSPSNPDLRNWASSRWVFPCLLRVLVPDPQSI